jgi:hypothetical protein
MPRKKQKSNAPAKKASATPKPAAFEVGNVLEYRIQRLQIFMGYLVRRGRPIYTIANLDRATDLDVYALRFVEPFSCEIIISECKTGGEGPLDRIFWLAGLKSYIKAKEALLIRKGTKWNIKEFAKQCQIQVVDLFKIEELEKNFNINDTDWPGLSDIDFIKKEAEGWNRIISSDKRIWELYSTLISEIRFNDSFPAINYLLSQMRLLTKMFKDIPSESFYRFLFSECISQLLVFCMRISEQCFDLVKDDREGFIRKGLTYGSMEPKYADRLLESAYNLARQAVLYYTSKEVEIDKSLFEMPGAPGTDGILILINKIFTAYPNSLRLPQTCDFLLSELFTKQYPARGLLRRIFPQATLAKQIELMRWYLKVLISMDACPTYIYETLEFEALEKNGKSHLDPISTKKVVKNPETQKKLFKDEEGNVFNK